MSLRFPFAIFYDFDGTNVDVFAVLDCRQDPNAMEARLSS